VGERQKRIGQILREMDLVTEPQIQRALTIQHDRGGVLGEILVHLGYAEPDEILRALAVQVGLQFVDLAEVPPEETERTFRWLKADKIRFDVPEGPPDPVADLVDHLLTTALDAGATEIRLERLADRLQIRYRVDGVLTEMEPLPRHLAPPILERVRRMTGLSSDPAAERVERHVRAVFAGRRFHVEAISFRTAADETVALRFSPAS
jgi:type II secretory ATPase GspE/PulE/Tfp pilus assembly ATPase PilB-like protein